MKIDYKTYTSNIEVDEGMVEAVAKTMLAKDLSWPFGVTEEFENAIADFLGTKHVLAHCNATSAMYSALFAVGVTKGTEVICPTYTFWASVAPAVNLGAKVVFCDINEDDLLVSLESIRNVVTQNTKAIILPHLWGRYVNVDEVKKICSKFSHKIYIIEDASHSFGAKFDNKFVGTIGDVGIFSLQAGKPLVAGEGGILVTDDFSIFDKSVYLGHYERIKKLDNSSYREYEKTGGGYKFRIHPLGSAIALYGLKRIKSRLATHNLLMAYFEQELEKIDGIQVASKAYPNYTYGGRFGFRVIVDLSEEQLMKFIKKCSKEGLCVEEEYIPLLHKEKFFNKYEDSYTLLPSAEKMYPKIISLPVFYSGDYKMVDSYVTQFRNILQSLRK
jgi:perosamine synthetase